MYNIRAKSTSAYGIKDRRITTCKFCRFGIFEEEEKIWRNKNPLGYVHKKCNENLEKKN